MIRYRLIEGHLEGIDGHWRVTSVSTSSTSEQNVPSPLTPKTKSTYKKALPRIPSPGATFTLRTTSTAPSLPNYSPTSPKTPNFSVSPFPISRTSSQLSKPILINLTAISISWCYSTPSGKFNLCAQRIEDGHKYMVFLKTNSLRNSLILQYI